MTFKNCSFTGKVLAYHTDEQDSKRLISRNNTVYNANFTEAVRSKTASLLTMLPSNTRFLSNGRCLRTTHSEKNAVQIRQIPGRGYVQRINLRGSVDFNTRNSMRHPPFRK